jgi:hypothetical protein
VETYCTDRVDWAAELKRSITSEILGLGVHHSVAVMVVPAATGTLEAPTVGVYLGSVSAVRDAPLIAEIEIALRRGLVVIPVVDALENFATQVPTALRPVHGFEWTGTDPSRRLARKVLEELGVEDRRRRVFISHKRDDGLAVAEQLHDFLSHHGFEPFIDRFGVGLGRDVQNEIADALEDCAFLLLIETPLAAGSEWAFWEVDYALSHQMGMHILTWPGDVPELPGTNRLLRQRLNPADLRSQRGYDVLTDAALDGILGEVEAIHANAIVRRRRYLLRSAEEAARNAGFDSTPLEDWRLLVQAGAGPSLVQVSARLPTVADLYSLDQAMSRPGATVPSGVLIHSARQLSSPRREELAWATRARNLTLVPENAIGRFWP